MVFETMTKQWTNGGLRGYATRDEDEAKRQFRRRHGRMPEIVICKQDEISCVYFLGPVEDSRHGKR